jgi:hypothetical protein
MLQTNLRIDGEKKKKAYVSLSRTWLFKIIHICTIKNEKITGTFLRNCVLNVTACPKQQPMFLCTSDVISRQ